MRDAPIWNAVHRKNAPETWVELAPPPPPVPKLQRSQQRPTQKVHESEALGCRLARSTSWSRWSENQQAAHNAKCR